MKQIIITKDTISEDFAEIGKYVDEHIKDSSLIIEVRKYDRQKEISHNQMKYIHCDAGPIQIWAKESGDSIHASELYLKRECGEHIFIYDLSMRTMKVLEPKRGVPYWECSNSVCRKLIDLDMIKIDHEKRLCPHCEYGNPRLIKIISKTELTTKETNEWIDSMYLFIKEKGVNIQMPDNEWRQRKEIE